MTPPVTEFGRFVLTEGRLSSGTDSLDNGAIPMCRADASHPNQPDPSVNIGAQQILIERTDSGGSRIIFQPDLAAGGNDLQRSPSERELHLILRDSRSPFATPLASTSIEQHLLSHELRTSLSRIRQLIALTRGDNSRALTPDETAELSRLEATLNPELLALVSRAREGHGNQGFGVCRLPVKDSSSSSSSGPQFNYYMSLFDTRMDNSCSDPIGEGSPLSREQGINALDPGTAITPAEWLTLLESRDSSRPVIQPRMFCFSGSGDNQRTLFSRDLQVGTPAQYLEGIISQLIGVGEIRSDTEIPESSTMTLFSNRRAHEIATSLHTFISDYLEAREAEETRRRVTAQGLQDWWDRFSRRVLQPLGVPGSLLIGAISIYFMRRLINVTVGMQDEIRGQRQGANRNGLREYTSSITDEVRYDQRRLPYIGREEQLDVSLSRLGDPVQPNLIITTANRPDPNNPNRRKQGAGVGKSAFVQELSRRVSTWYPDADPALRDHSVHPSLRRGRVEFRQLLESQIAGGTGGEGSEGAAKYAGQYEERIMDVLEGARRSERPTVIVFEEAAALFKPHAGGMDGNWRSRTAMHRMLPFLEKRPRVVEGNLDVRITHVESVRGSQARLALEVVGEGRLPNNGTIEVFNANTDSVITINISENRRQLSSDGRTLTIEVPIRSDVLESERDYFEIEVRNPAGERLNRPNNWRGSIFVTTGAEYTTTFGDPEWSSANRRNQVIELVEYSQAETIEGLMSERWRNRAEQLWDVRISEEGIRIAAELGERHQPLDSEPARTIKILETAQSLMERDNGGAPVLDGDAIRRSYAIARGMSPEELERTEQIHHRIGEASTFRRTLELRSAIGEVLRDLRRDITSNPDGLQTEIRRIYEQWDQMGEAERGAYLAEARIRQSQQHGGRGLAEVSLNIQAVRIFAETEILTSGEASVSRGSVGGQVIDISRPSSEARGGNGADPAEGTAPLSPRDMVERQTISRIAGEVASARENGHRIGFSAEAIEFVVDHVSAEPGLSLQGQEAMAHDIFERSVDLAPTYAREIQRSDMGLALNAWARAQGLRSERLEAVRSFFTASETDPAIRRFWSERSGSASRNILAGEIVDAWRERDGGFTIYVIDERERVREVATRHLIDQGHVQEADLQVPLPEPGNGRIVLTGWEELPERTIDHSVIEQALRRRGAAGIYDAHDFDIRSIRNTGDLLTYLEEQGRAGAVLDALQERHPGIPIAEIGVEAVMAESFIQIAEREGAEFQPRGRNVVFRTIRNGLNGNGSGPAEGSHETVGERRARERERRLEQQRRRVERDVMRRGR